MAEQTLIQFRADKALKREVAEIYEALGMDLPTAFRMFLAKSKQVRGLPFSATLPAEESAKEQGMAAFVKLRNQASQISEMSLDEINGEIEQTRRGMRVACK